MHLSKSLSSSVLLAVPLYATKAQAYTSEQGFVLLLPLVFCFALCVWPGTWFANYRMIDEVTFGQSFTQWSASILPIALVDHFAHFLTAFLVNSQYALAAATDPMQRCTHSILHWCQYRHH